MTLENTDKAMAELLEKLPDIIEGASGHLPDIASQMLVYGAYDAKITLIFGGILLVLGLILGIKGLFDYNSEVPGIIGVMLIGLSSIMIICGISSASIVLCALLICTPSLNKAYGILFS